MHCSWKEHYHLLSKHHEIKPWIFPWGHRWQKSNTNWQEESYISSLLKVNCLQAGKSDTSSCHVCQWAHAVLPSHAAPCLLLRGVENNRQGLWFCHLPPFHSSSTYFQHQRHSRKPHHKWFLGFCIFFVKKCLGKSMSISIYRHLIIIYEKSITYYL